MNTDKIEDVMSELLGEGYRIVWEDGTLSPAIDWVDWIEDPEDEEKEKVEVTFQDDPHLRQGCSHAPDLARGRRLNHVAVISWVEGLNDVCPIDKEGDSQ